MLITQRPHAARLHQERRLLQPLPNPPHRERPQDMSVPHHQHIPLPHLPRLRINLTLANHRPVVVLADMRDEPVDAQRNVRRGLAVRAAVAPDVPGLGEVLGGAEGADFVGGDALVGAIVPLSDVRGDGDGGGGVAGGVVEGGRGWGGGGLPGVRHVAAEVEELEGGLGAVPGGDVAVSVLVVGSMVWGTGV